MGNLSFSEKFKIPKYNDSTQLETGLIQVNQNKCTGCSLCTKACPADAIELKGKIAKPCDPFECMACGDCVAICPEEAITLVRSYRYSGMFKTIDQGELVKPRM